MTRQILGWFITCVVFVSTPVFAQVIPQADPASLQTVDGQTMAVVGGWATANGYMPGRAILVDGNALGYTFHSPRPDVLAFFHTYWPGFSVDDESLHSCMGQSRYDCQGELAYLNVTGWTGWHTVQIVAWDPNDYFHTVTFSNVVWFEVP